MAVNLRKDLAPIVLFGYNRPQHILRTLDALNRNKWAEKSRLFIYLDGPRNELVEKKCNEVLEICQNFNWVGEKTIIKRSRNYGLADNIVSGVTEVVEKFGEVIVLEDDIETSPGFLQYMNEALNLFQENNEVMHINGYVPDGLLSPFLKNTFFTRFMNCWGWATWKNKWKYFESDPEVLLNRINNSEDKDAFGLHGAVNAENQLIENITGEINTWAVKWNASVFSMSGLCLNPRKSLVRNIGMDGSGIHFNSKNSGNNKFAIANLASEIKIKKRRSKISFLGEEHLEMAFRLGNQPALKELIKYGIYKFKSKTITPLQTKNQ